MSKSLNILAIGASRNTGYWATLRFLDAGADVTFVLRYPTAFDTDEIVQKYIKAGKVHLVKGDGMVEADMRNAWQEALKYGNVDLLLFTVGARTIKVHPIKGLIITPENLVTQCLLNSLCTIPENMPLPRIITISSNGLTKASHAALPALLKPLYGYFLAAPHKDKVGAERVIAYLAGLDWNVADDGEPGDEIMGPAWRERKGLPAPGSLSQVLVVRPALLTDGEAKADKTQHAACGKVKEPYRISDHDISGWTISRKDTGHFIADAMLNHWDEYSGKRISLAY